MLKLGRAQGVAIAAAMAAGVEVCEYSPRKIKQSITGYGNASKEQIARFLQQILRIELKPETLDATDGLAAAMCHFYQENNPVAKAITGKGWEDFIKNNPDRISGK